MTNYKALVLNYLWHISNMIDFLFSKVLKNDLPMHEIFPFVSVCQNLSLVSGQFPMWVLFFIFGKNSDEVQAAACFLHISISDVALDVASLDD